MTAWGIQHYIIFVMGTIGIVLLPGPNSLFVLSLALQNRIAAQNGYWHKIKVPFMASLGIMAGDTVLMLFANLGVASILHANPRTFAVLSALSGLYIIYVGFGMLKEAYCIHKNKRQPAHPLERTLPAFTSPKKAFIKAWGISLINPKAILFFTTFFVQFIQTNYRPIWQPLFILMLTLQIISMAYLMGVIFLGQKLVHGLQARPEGKIMGLVVLGALFIGCGIYFLSTV